MAQGTVQAVNPKQTKTNKTYFSVNVDGTWFSMWEKPNFTKGQEIEFDIIQKGDFKNLANTKVLEAGATVGTQSGPSRPVSSNRPNGSFDPDREARIVRQNAISSAIALVAASKVAGKSDVESLLAVVKETAKEIFKMNMYGYEKEPDIQLPNAQEANTGNFFDE